MILHHNVLNADRGGLKRSMVLSGDFEKPAPIGSTELSRSSSFSLLAIQLATCSSPAMNYVLKISGISAGNRDAPSR